MPMKTMSFVRSILSRDQLLLRLQVQLGQPLKTRCLLGPGTSIPSLA